MEIVKPNDMLVAVYNNPNATPYDFLSSGITPENTSLLTKEDYKSTKFVQDKFRTDKGDFDNVKFEEFFKETQAKFNLMSDEQYMKDLDTVIYSPFDINRPKFAETFDVSVEFSKDYNPYKQVYSRTALNSIGENEFSLRELAQQNQVYDPKTKKWSDVSANELSIWEKLFGDTLVYAQYDEDTEELDKLTGKLVKYKKGDWKVNEDGHLYIEKLAGREVYGKQVVNPMDMLTTDGSIINKYDFLDSDGREKSLGGTVVKTAFEIAPLLIPGFNVAYGGAKAAVGLASVLPTFYKTFESILVGDKQTSLTDMATEAEGWMSKFTQRSTSDEAAGSLFNAEQIIGMVSDVFGQIYEQRAAASLSKLVIRKDKALSEASKKVARQINEDLLKELSEQKIKIEDFNSIREKAMLKIPELKSIIDKQSQMSKALALGYMALTSTGQVYGDAIQGGYDRRTAGFASLASAAGMYGLMMNNRMGDWFLDSTTGYSAGTNKALLRKSILPYMDEVKRGFDEFAKSPEVSKARLAGAFSKMKTSMNNFFLTPSVIGEGMWKNAMIEGVEEVTEEVVQDAVKGITDMLSYLGFTKQTGSFGTAEKLTSREGLEQYLANFVGGLLGGALFEMDRTVISPFMRARKLDPITQKNIYELVAAGHKEDLIRIVNQERNKLGNKYLSLYEEDGIHMPASNSQVSQANLVADKTIELINYVDGVLNSHDLIKTDAEIVKKAIRDDIIIAQLNKTRPEKSLIGLEGLVLEDFKTNMVKIANLDTELKQLEPDPNNAEKVKVLKEQLKEHKDKVNKIMSGEKSMDYFDRITMYLTTPVNSNFIVLDRDTFTRKKYNKSYKDLPDTGIGLSKEVVNKEWLESVESRDLKKELTTITNAYKELEKLLNGPIAQFTESGYDVVRKDYYNSVVDLKKQLEIFNTSEDKEKKTQALKNFIAINDKLDAMKLSKISPWDIYNTNIFEQLASLGLLEKTEYILDDTGELVESSTKLSEDELNQIDASTGLSNKDIYKQIIQGYLKRFPINPLILEDAINDFNINVQNQNKATLLRIKSLENIENKTEEDIQEISKLKNSLINIKIGSINNTPIISNLIAEKNDLINAEKEDLGIKDEDLAEFEKRILEKDLYEKSFNEVVRSIISPEGAAPEIKIDWTSLNYTQLTALLTALEELGILSKVIANLQASENTGDVISEILTKLSGNITEEQYTNEVLPLLEKIFSIAEQIIDSGYQLVHNKELLDFYRTKSFVEENYNSKIQNAKPGLLKVHNYAYDLLLNLVKSGNTDIEVFNELKKLFEAEVHVLNGVLLPGFSSMTTDDTLFMINNAELISRVVSAQVSNEHINLETVSDLLIKLDKFSELLPLKRIIENNSDKEASVKEKNSIGRFLSTFNSEVKNRGSQINRIKEFIELSSIESTLKINPLYEFLRNFVLSLNSDPNGKVIKILDILEREEKSLKASSSTANYTADNIRTQDINQAIGALKMIRAVVLAMSTTTVNFNDPIGFIAARQNFAKRNGIQDDVLNLKTISSDIATLMQNDIDRILNKLEFVKELSNYNSGRIAAEDNIIRKQMNSIFVDEWKKLITNINPSFLPIEKLNDILSSKDNDEKKLTEIENLIFDESKDRQKEVLKEILTWVEKVDPDDFTVINKDTMKDTVKGWDLATYFSMVLSSRANDFYIREYSSLNGKYNRAPFYTQELNARMIKASTNNPELFASIYNTKKRSGYENADFITFVLGNAGSGKTSAVIGLVIDNFRQTNENSTIWLTAPDDSQVNNLEKGILDAVGEEGLDLVKFNKNKLFERLNLTSIIVQIEKELRDSTNKDNLYITNEDRAKKFTLPENWDAELDFNNLPNLLVIDEVTHFSAAELNILNTISRISFENDSLNFMKVIGAGDTSQLGYLVENSYEYNVNAVNGIFTPRLWMSVRANNIQNRTNVDNFSVISDKVQKIYYENVRQDESIINNKISKFLKDINTITGLDYYVGEDFINGAYVSNGIDKSMLSIIKKDIDKNPEKEIGILTSNGQISAELGKVLSELGLITPEGNHPSIKLFSPSNIQGREIDYFIFDADAITKFGKLRDKIKAFYTYISRSKSASIIIDPSNSLKEYLDISNNNPSTYPLIFDPLTADVIRSLKEERISAIKDLLGDNMNVVDDDFKWDISTEESSNVNESSIELLPNKLFVDWDDNSKTGEKKSDENLSKLNSKKLIEAGEFKFILHGFYKNPNAIIKDGKIIVNPNNHSSDLNLLSDIEDTNEAQKVITAWSKLKSYIIHHLNDFDDDSKMTILSNDFSDYLKNIFKEQSKFENTQNVDVELLLTAVNYNSEINNPYAKEGFDENNVLKDKDSFINLTAKLWFGDNYHYVTLATFATQGKIQEWISNNITEGDGRKALLLNINNKFTDIRNSLNKDPNSILELTKVSKNDLNIYTSTRLIKTDKKYKLSNLEKEFPGMNYSELRMFPSTLDAFRNLVHKYTFGDPRSEDRIQELFRILKNTPYIVVSYADDLNGSNDNNVTAKLIPVSSNKRKTEVLIKEVEGLRKLISNDIHAQYDGETLKPEKVRISDEFNAKSEMLLNRSQILDILIEWAQPKEGNSPLIELLTEKVSLSSLNKIVNKDHTVLDILNNFSGGTNRTITNLLDVINETKNSIKRIQSMSTEDLTALVNKILKKKNLPESTISKYIENGKPTEAKFNEIVKYDILDNIPGKTGWHWNFYNLFAYKSIIDNKEDADFMKLVYNGVIDMTSIVDDSGYKNLQNIVSRLVDSLKDKEFYYSIPIKSKNKELIVNPFISGSSGFSEDNYGDKLYINVAPEEVNMLANITNIFSNMQLSNKETPKKVVKSTKNKSKELLQNLSEEINNYIKDNIIDIGTLVDDDIKSIKGYIDKLNTLLTDSSMTKKDLTYINNTIQLLKNAIIEYDNSRINLSTFIKKTTTKEGISIFEGIEEFMQLFSDMEFKNTVVFTINKLLEDISGTDLSSREIAMKLFGDNYLNIPSSIPGTFDEVAISKYFFDKGIERSMVLDYFEQVGEKLNQCK